MVVTKMRMEIGIYIYIYGKDVIKIEKKKILSPLLFLSLFPILYLFFGQA